ncbi:MAG: DUF1778 domain-containing protein [Vulcanimicrobiaceae bacterium]
MLEREKAEQARVDFRVPASVKARFVEAAALETGGDLSAFLVAAGLERAERVLAQREVVRIDDETRERFYAAMRAPARPTKALRRLLSDEGSRFRLVE